MNLLEAGGEFGGVEGEGGVDKEKLRQPLNSFLPKVYRLISLHDTPLKAYVKLCQLNESYRPPLSMAASSQT